MHFCLSQSVIGPNNHDYYLFPHRCWPSAFCSLDLHIPSFWLSLLLNQLNWIIAQQHLLQVLHLSLQVLILPVLVKMESLDLIVMKTAQIIQNHVFQVDSLVHRFERNSLPLPIMVVDVVRAAMQNSSSQNVILSAMTPFPR